MLEFKGQDTCHAFHAIEHVAKMFTTKESRIDNQPKVAASLTADVWISILSKMQFVTLIPRENGLVDTICIDSSIPSVTTLSKLSTGTDLTETTSNILSAPAQSPSWLWYNRTAEFKSEFAHGFTLQSILPLPSTGPTVTTFGGADKTRADPASLFSTASSSGSFSGNINDPSDTSRIVSGYPMGTSAFSGSSR
ncbi:hypothetical protein GYMLUDRAFT_251992 [Collybiopsis luxurians FD-317 M1]|uniref:Uncharacterized protein n=1 Tax=Collybiopsis luxurians FD-317 M1 TaxID=944289 RepID=A0A0D0AMW1_9AGAR|nr:hypothetical protein GYMLUDRAFT_251992 [Collybiopsis luxurians FD-317 M1]